MHRPSTLKILLLALFSLSVVAGASAQHVPPPLMSEPMPLMLAQGLEPALKPHPAPEPNLETPVARQCVCTMQYDPVCARRQDGIEATYSNACQAQCERATVTRRGRC
jgi:hypothetical protein